MKHLLWLLLGAAMTTLLVGPAVAAEAGKTEAAKADKEALRGEFAIMANACNLTDAQKAELLTKATARKDALAAWDKANAESLKTARDAARKAKQGTDAAAAKEAAAKVKAIEAERTKIDTETMAAILAILTPDQKAVWASFDTYRRVLARFRRADLTDAQKTRIREAAAEASKPLATLSGDEARKARQAVEAGLRKTIEETILTAEQREALKKKPEKKPADGTKPAAPKAER